MTRETKIGLLVGLAFIIIVGILLSEPLNHAGDAQPAPLPGAGQNVRVAVASPGTASAAPISMQSAPAATPAQQVPTQQEVTRPRGGIQIVVGGGDPSTPATQTPQPRTTPLSNAGQVETTPTREPVATNKEPAQPAQPTREPAVGHNSDPIFTAAAQNGETLVPLGAKPQGQTPAGKATAKANRQYEVVAGDSLSKIAQKFYGSSSKSYRDAIVNANPSLKADPNKLMAGVTYVIPAVDAPAAATPAQTPSSPVAQKPTPKVPSTENLYTVKSGDNLWAIARDQCGDPAAVAALKELNKDALKGGDGVKVGMKLRLPNKPVASIN